MVLHPEDLQKPGISQPMLTKVPFDLPHISPQSDGREPSKLLRVKVGTVLSLWLRTIKKRSAVP